MEIRNKKQQVSTCRNELLQSESFIKNLVVTFVALLLLLQHLP
jgi:hypothetical protein